MFLASQEALLIKKDFRDILAAYDAVDVLVRYKIPVNPVVDPVYGHVSADSWQDAEIETTALQQFIKPRDMAILSWGFLTVGDCIFYFSEDLDLSIVDFDTGILVTGGVEWVPVTGGDLKAANEYAIFRMQIGQVAQVVPCKLRP